MTDATPAHDDAPAQQGTSPRRAQRGRLLAIGAVVAVAVALGGGVAAAVAAVVSRQSTPAATPGGASLYFPLAGNQPQSGGASGAMNAAPMPTIADGGMAAGGRAFSPSFANGPAMSSSLAYPYPGGWCSAAPAPAASGPGITATGLAQVNLPGAPANAQTLNIGVQDNNSSDLKTALNDVEQRLAAIRAALHTAGVTDDHISQQGLNIYGNGGPKVTNFGVNAGLTATISDAAILDRAVHAAADAGGTSINVWSGNGATTATPDDKSLQSAIAKATDAAHSMAQSQAQAAGVSLGALQSSQVQPPSICNWTASGAQMVVGVTLTYAIK
jgi:uncharacterized protein YggE